MRTQSRFRRSRLWLIAEATAVIALAAIAVSEHTTIERSLSATIHADGGWVAATFAFELSSIMTFARTQRVILREIGGRISILSMAATATIGNAISFTLPVVGPGASTAFTFQRFVGFGSERAAASWALGTAWILSSAARSLMLIVGALVSGDLAASLVGLSLLGVILLAARVLIVGLRRPAFRTRASNVAVKFVRLFARVSRRPDHPSDDRVEETLGRLVSYRMTRRRWAEALILSLINWAGGAACLVAAILAVGALVPWSKILLVYCAGATVSSFNLTPGGLGVVEFTLTAALVAAGNSSKSALGAVLIFRIATFWVPIAAGWGLYALVDRRAQRTPTSRS